MTDLRAHLQSTLGLAYTIERELGGGGMSRVFVATEQALGRPVVVKVLPNETAGALSMERFRREIRLAASLQQANIVPVLAAGDAGGVAYYTMPFVKGESLRSHLAARGALPVAECVAILRDVARALAYAHSEGVVHRDIKPENILLSGGTAVVTDFGIAKAVAASSTHAGGTTLTQMGMTLGTPAYMAPEQAVGEQVDHRADIYALGVLAYEMLTGSTPFAGRSAQAMVAAHLTEAPPALTDKRPDAAPGLVALVMGCLAKEQSDRPQSASAVLTALGTMTTAQAIVATKAAKDEKPSLAVLPFANLSPDPADEYFADGLTDEIITDLLPIHSLRVIARASMMRFKGSGKDPQSVAREVNVRYVLDGSVRRAGTSLRLTVRLTDTDDGSVLWSDKLGGSVEDVFAMQEKVSRTIVESLRVTLTPREDDGLAARPIKDLRAYEAFLQARQLMWTFTIDSLGRAVQLLANALALVGDDARLVGTLGQTHLHYLHAGLPEPERHISEAERCVRRLAPIDPDSFFVHSLEGQLHLLRGEMREAITSHESARARDPNDAATACHLSLEYLLSGRDSEAREAADVAAMLDPLTPLFQCMPGFCLWFGGRAAEGVPYYRRFLAMEPLNPTPHFFLQVILAHAGETREAIALGEQLERLFPESVFGALGSAYARALRGDLDGSRAAITPAVRVAAAETEMFSRFLMDLFAINGDADAAAAAAESAAAKGFAHYPWLARHNRFVAPLREHPRFRHVLDLIRRRWERGGTSARDLADHAVAASATAVGQERPTVAVLPLANLSASADDEYFADGMTEDIIAQLSQIKSLKVIARTSVMPYKKAEKSAREIASELGVSHIATGSVRRAGQRLRIVAQLIDARSDEQVWARTFDRDLVDVFAIQSEVAEDTARALAATLTADERARINKPPTTNLEAYDLLQLGRFYTEKWSAEGWQKGVALLRQAIACDPRYAAPHATLAINYAVRAYVGALPTKDAFEHAESEARQALELGGADSDAHLALAYVLYFLRWDWEAAVREFQMALAITPGNAHARTIYGTLLDTLGRHTDSMVERTAAMELSPLDAVATFNVGYGHMIGRRYDEAAKYFRRALELERHNTGAIYGLGMTQIAAKDAAGACATFEAAVDAGDMSTASKGFLGWAYGMAGRTTDAERVLAELRTFMTTHYVSPYHLALVYHGLGRTSDLFEWLERSYAERSMWLVWFHVTPVFDSVRRDARFESIVRRMGLPPEAGLPPE